MRRAAGRALCNDSLWFIEDWDVVQRVKVFPGHSLWIGNPVLFAAGIAARGFAFVKKCHISGLRALLEFSQLGCLIGLEAQVVKP